MILRQDRWLLPLWVLVLPLIPPTFVTAFTSGFPTPQALQHYAETSIDNAVFTVFYGRLHGASLGELVAWRGGAMPLMVGLLSLLTVIRTPAPRSRPAGAS